MIGYIDTTSFPVYTYGEMIIVTPYHIRWTPSDISSGTFSIDGSTYNFSDYSGEFLFYKNSITYSAFNKNLDITTIDTDVNIIGQAAFGYCYNLSEVSLSNVTSISYMAFFSCYALSSVYLPECSIVGAEAFGWCSGMTSISLPKCGALYTRALYRTSISEIYLPVCSNISAFAFYNCPYLSTITLGGSSVCVLSNSNAFQGTGITSTTGFIYVPHSLLEDYKVAPEWSYFWQRIYTIGYVPYLYSKINRSMKIEWVDNTYQGYIRSQYVSSIFSVDRSIHSSTDIDDVAYYVVWLDMSYFETNIPYINWTRDMSYFETSNPSSKYRHYNESNSRQYFNGAYTGEFSVPQIKSVYFPDCSYMSPKHMQNLVSIVSASFPALEFVPYCGFRNCYALPSIDLPACSSIFSYAFVNCSSLKEITLRRRFVCYLENSNAFSNTPIGLGSGSIYVPSSLVSSYKSASEWSYFSSQIFPINN